MTTAPLTTPASQDSLPQILIETFEDHALTRITVQGRPCYPARDIGTALGYAQNGKRFADKVTGAWSSEMVEGRDYEVLTGDALEALKLAAEHGTSEVPSFAARLLVLYERGLHIALLKTNKRAGHRLRAWLADRAMPALARGKSIDANGETFTPSEPPCRLSVSELRETRLCVDRMVKGGVLSKEQGAKLLAEAMVRFAQGHLPPAAVELAKAGARVGVVPENQRPPAPMVHQTIIQRGKPLALLGSVKPLPDGDREPPVPLQQIADTWLSPMQIAEAIGMVGTFHERKARVGHAITGAGFREHPKLAHPISVPKLVNGAFLADAEGKVKMTQGWAYRPDVIDPIRVWLRENRPEWLQASA